MPIPGYAGSYEVSDHGQVRSIARIDYAGRRWPGRILKPGRTGSGGDYLKVTLCRDGQVESRAIHRLVLLAFAGEPSPGLVARHLNGVPSDNRLSNLAWGTQSENNQDTVRHGNNRELRKTHCPSGHPYAGDNLRINRKGHRLCRTCGRQKLNARRARRRAELSA